MHHVRYKQSRNLYCIQDTTAEQFHQTAGDFLSQAFPGKAGTGMPGRVSDRSVGRDRYQP